MAEVRFEFYGSMDPVKVSERKCDWSDSIIYYHLEGDISIPSQTVPTMFILEPQDTRFFVVPHVDGCWAMSPLTILTWTWKNWPCWDFHLPKLSMPK